jgi:hypothetical protein
MGKIVEMRIKRCITRSKKGVRSRSGMQCEQAQKNPKVMTIFSIHC